MFWECSVYMCDVIILRETVRTKTWKKSNFALLENSLIRDSNEYVFVRSFRIRKLLSIKGINVKFMTKSSVILDIFQWTRV